MHGHTARTGPPHTRPGEQGKRALTFTHQVLSICHMPAIVPSLACGHRDSDVGRREELAHVKSLRNDGRMISLRLQHVKSLPES
jgi:hypothetical protein